MISGEDLLHHPDAMMERHMVLVQLEMLDCIAPVEVLLIVAKLVVALQDITAQLMENASLVRQVIRLSRNVMAVAFVAKQDGISMMMAQVSNFAAHPELQVM